MVLYINACVRKNSRTNRLAKCLLDKLGEPFTEVRLEHIRFPVTDEEYLTKRDQMIDAGDFSDPAFSLANQFAAADRIVIAAPYWDLSFPAALKQYFEHINVRGFALCVRLIRIKRDKPSVTLRKIIVFVQFFVDPLQIELAEIFQLRNRHGTAHGFKPS